MDGCKIASWVHPEDSETSFELWGPFPIHREGCLLARVRCWDSYSEEYFSSEDSDPEYLAFLETIPPPPKQNILSTDWYFCGWENDGQYALYGSEESSIKIRSSNYELTKR